MRGISREACDEPERIVKNAEMCPISANLGRGEECLSSDSFREGSSLSAVGVGLCFATLRNSIKH